VTPATIAAMRGLPDPLAAGAGVEAVPYIGRMEIEFQDHEAALRARALLEEALSRVAEIEAIVRMSPSALAAAAGGSGGVVEIVAAAADEEGAGRLADRVGAAVTAATGGMATREEALRPSPAVFLGWDEGRLARLGLGRQVVEEEVRSALGPVEVGRVEIEGVQPEIRVDATLPESLPLIPMGVPRLEPDEEGPGAPRVVPLAALANIEEGLRPAKVRREGGRPAVRLVISSKGPAGRPKLDGRVLQDVISGIPLAAGESVRFGGEALEIARSFEDLRLALALSLVLVFLTIAALYESLLLPCLILVVVPVAAGGAFALLAITRQSLNVMSLLGLILLGGIVVKNAIVLVDRIERLRAEGLAEDEALRSAASDRYRPIVMTTATTVLGMLPLAILGGEGVELRRALSLTVLGGLTTSTFASLLLIPVLHRAMDRLRPGKGEAAAGGIRVEPRP
jgi:hydrophobic/amphiphilic exporter-1 (mainly G- bacteria), HAE1 family